MKKPIINKTKKQTYFKKDGIDKLLKHRESFQLIGAPGVGKSHSLKKIIIPYLNENNLKYIVSSTTKENAKDVNGETIQSMLGVGKYSYFDLRHEYKNIDYLIIDESSQLSQKLLKYINYIKLHTSTKFIFIGDNNQCKSIDAYKESWLDTWYVKNLADNNIVKLEWHKKARYDNKMNELICFMTNNMKNKYTVKKYVYGRIKKRVKTITEKNICYYNSTIKTLENEKIKCNTTHKQQGKTIDEDFSIHDVYNMPIDVLYTAISRAKSLDQITLIVPQQIYDKYI